MPPLQQPVGYWVVPSRSPLLVGQRLSLPQIHNQPEGDPKSVIISTLFDHVIEKSYSWMKTDSERARIVDECRLSHHVQREGEKALEYRVRVTNYAERGLFDMDEPDKTQIYWYGIRAPVLMS
jgi:hypothetical protein